MFSCQKSANPELKKHTFDIATACAYAGQGMKQLQRLDETSCKNCPRLFPAASGQSRCQLGSGVPYAVCLKPELTDS